jgi:hypothetical protein
MKSVTASPIATIAVAVSALSSSGGAFAAPAAHPDLSGFWEVRDDSKPPSTAPLTPEVAARAKAQAEATAARMAKGILYPPGAPLCVHRGVVGAMGDSAPTNIIQTDREIAMLWEATAAPRHIYMDGRAWPDPKTLQSGTNGYSIGHWEGPVLVVETRGFDPRHGQGAAGGKTLKTRLVEHYRLIDKGTKMAVEFTWTDPAIYTKPYTYTWTYYRDPPDTYAAELICDASDPKQALSVIPPSQN